MRFSDIKVKKRVKKSGFRFNPAAVKLAGLFLVLTILVTGFWFALQTIALNPPSGNPPAGTGSILDATSSAPANTITIKSDGSVGVGTTSPNYELSIVGDLNFTGTLYQNGIAVSTSSYWTASSSDIYYNSGNVGIGTTNPTYKLSVAGVIHSTTGGFRFPDGTTQTTLAVSQWTTSGSNIYRSTGNMGIGTATPARKTEIVDTTGPQLQVKRGSTTPYTEFYMRSTGDLTVDVYGAGGSQLVLDNAGYIGLGTSTPSAKLHVVENSEASACGSPCYAMTINGNTSYPRIYFKSGDASVSAVFNLESTSGTSKDMFFGEDSDTAAWNFRGSGAVGITSGKLAIGTDQVPEAYRVYANGTLYSTGGWQSSDERLKENITPLTDVSSKLEHLTGVSFDWKVSQFPNKGLPKGTQLGLIAQEVETQFPELINSDAEGYKTLSYNGFSAILIQAFKELKHRLDTLETTLNQGRLTLQELTSKKITVETGVIGNLQLVDRASGELRCLGISNGQRIVKTGACE